MELKKYLELIVVLIGVALISYAIFILPAMLVCLLAVIFGAIAITLTEFFKSCLLLSLFFISAVIIVGLYFAIFG